MSRAAAILLAAGAASRMRGGDKLLEIVDGEPLIRRLARAALESAARETIVTTGRAPQRIRAALEALPVRIAHNPDWAAGMGGSIATGVRAAAPDASGFLIVPGDMPELTASLFDTILSAADRDDAILRPQTPSGRFGHPVYFGTGHRTALEALTGDSGAKSVISTHKAQFRVINVLGESAAIDLDAPEEWSAWREMRLTHS